MALVTGASRGIGLATARALTAAGGPVVAVARAWTPAPENALFDRLVADVTVAEDRARVRAHVEAVYGRLDVLVNNVGGNVRRPTMDYDDEALHAVLRTNFESAWGLCRAFEPLLAASGAGSIVNVSSVAAQRALRTSSAAYAASKAALEALTRFLAVEWAPRGIRVNAVAPWYVETPLAAAVLEDPEKRARVLARTPAGRVGEPEEVAAAISFLASPAASWITGVVLPVDGGFSALGL